MNFKSSTLYSILAVRCPRCHEGKMFPSGTLYSPGKFMQMNPNCSRCGQSFEPEPGYYFGAMFVSYAINTAFLVGVWLALYFLVDEITTGMLVTALLVIVIGLLPLTFRWSRVLWIAIFVRYEGPSDKIPVRKRVGDLWIEFFCYGVDHVCFKSFFKPMLTI